MHHARARPAPSCATVCKYTLFGAAFGLCFPAAAVAIDLFLHGAAPSWPAVRALFAANPIHFIVALAPFVLGATHHAIGRSRAALEAELDRRGRAEAKMRHRAFHDDLTGLPNRACLYEVLRARLGRPGAALVLLDLDAFKHVNDTLGHLAGDALLGQVAAHLGATVGRHGTVMRLGGDEFALLCDGVEDEAGLCATAAEVVHSFSRAFAVGAAELRCGASVGASFVLPGDAGADDAIRRADVALYEAKRAGGTCWRLYDAGMDERVRARVRLEADLRAAVERGEFVLHHQPLHDVRDGRITGFEALIRWRHPERGLLGPGEFIAAAEENGAIGAIGRWALHEACSAAAAWPGRVGVAVNVSPAQFAAGRLVGDVRSALDAAGLAPGRLTLEITENLFVGGCDGVVSELERVSASGVRIALDDFGTGYSSLGYLRRLPVDTIKIDGSFARAMTSDPAAAAIVEAIVGLAKGLHKRVTVEGIEHVAQLDAIRALGADTAQGYLFSKPVPLGQAARLIASCNAVSGGGVVGPYRAAGAA